MKITILQWKATGRYTEYSVAMTEKPESLGAQDGPINDGNNEACHSYLSNLSPC